jgi:hypothetical protein
MKNNITESEINNAISWYKINNIEVQRTDFQTGNVLSVVINGKNYELSNNEVSYRAELFSELQE